MSAFNMLVATPSLGFMKTRYTTSLIRLYDWFVRNDIPGYDSKYMAYVTIEGSVIPQAREDFCNDLLADPKFTHLLFIDEDMGFRPEALKSLIERKLPMVGCNYRMKVAPCNFTVRNKDNTGWIETNQDSTGVEEALFMGFGFNLIERRVIEAIQKPRFLGAYNHEQGKYSTEDGPFMVKAARQGFVPFVDHDASKFVYHCGNWAFSWDDHFEAEKRYPVAERIKVSA